METAREIRPNRRKMLIFAGGVIVGFWVLFGVIATFQAVWTWELVRNATLGLSAISCILAGTFLADWRSNRRTMWRVDETGIAIHRAGAVRMVRWSEIALLRVMAFGVMLRTENKPSVEHLYWLTRADGEWLHEMAKVQAGTPLR